MVIICYKTAYFLLKTHRKIPPNDVHNLSVSLVKCLSSYYNISVLISIVKNRARSKTQKRCS